MGQLTEKYMTLFPISSLSEYILHPVWVEVVVSILMQCLVRFLKSQGSTIQQRKHHLAQR